MNWHLLFRFLRLNLNTFGLTTLLWMTALYFYGTHENTISQQLNFILIATGISITFLHVSGFFRSVRVLPRKSDLLMICVALPTAGVVAWGIFTMASSEAPISLQMIALVTPPLSAVLFGIHSALEWFLVRNRNRKKIVLHLLEHEREEIIEHFRVRNYLSYVEFLGPTELKEAVLRQREDEIDQIIISRGAVRDLQEDSYLVRAHLAGVPIIDRRERAADLTGRIPLHFADSWSFVLTATRQTPLHRTYAQAKVILEPLIALVMLAAFLPLFGLIAIAVRWKSKGPIFYRQWRTGYLGKSFQLFKFRSMCVDSEIDGPKWATEKDNRVTPVGKVLRATRMDELPQLINVIRGEMSFFGPRPERPEFYQELKKHIPLFGLRTVIRPGITGWAQVCQGYASSIDDSRVKLEFDLYYIKHVSLRLDLIVLARTLGVALGASERGKALHRVKSS